MQCLLECSTRGANSIEILENRLQFHYTDCFAGRLFSNDFLLQYNSNRQYTIEIKYWRLQGYQNAELGYYRKLDRRCLRLCLHVEMISDLEFKRHFFSAVIIWYFSLRHKLQRFVRGEYGIECCNIFHSNE